MGTSTTYTATGSNVFNNTFDYFNNSFHNADLDNGLFTVLGTMNYATSTFAATVTSFDAHLSTQSGSDLLTIRNGFTSTWNSASETVTTSGNQVFLNNSLVGTYSFSNQDLAFSFSSGNNNPVTLGAIMDAVAYQNTATTRPDFTENVSFSFGTSAGSVSAPSAAIEVGFLPTPVISPAEIDFNANLSGTVATYPNTPVYILPNAHVTGHTGFVTNNQGQQEVWEPRWSTVSVSFVNANPGDRLIFDTSTKFVDGTAIGVNNGTIEFSEDAILVGPGWPGPNQILVDHVTGDEPVSGVNPDLDYILQSIQYENVSGSPSSSVQIAVSIGVATQYVIGPSLLGLGGSFFPLVDNEPQRVFTVNLTPLPTVVTEAATVTAGGSVTGTAGTAGTGALAGDSDANGFSLSISAITGGTLGSAVHGSYGDLTLQADGSYGYAAGATATELSNIAAASGPVTDAFTYSVSDGHGGVSPATLDIDLDATKPTIAAIAFSPASGELIRGATDTITLTLSNMGTVDTSHGAPTLTLNDGGTATYDAGKSTATTLAFDYTVTATDITIPSLAVSAVNLGGAVIDNTSGVAVASSLSVTGLSQSGPQVVNPSTLDFSDVAGHPHFLTSYTSGEFTIQVGGRNAFGDWSDVSPIGSSGSYLSGDVPGETFSLTNSARTFGIHSIDLNGDSGAGTGLAVKYTFTGADALGGAHTASFTTDAVWGWQTFALPSDFSAGLTNLSFTTSGPGFADFDNIVLDDPFTPTVTSITARPTAGDLGPGTKVTFSVTMSDSVTVPGGTTPFLTLNDGGQATYTGGSGTKVLTFVYTVGALGSGQNVSSLAVTGFNGNGAPIVDAHIATDPADLSGVTGFASGQQIDTTAPTIAAVVTSGLGIDAGGNAPPGLLGAGSTVTLTVDFSENVTVAGGPPSLKLSNGGIATYAGGSGTDALAFTYVIAVGQNTTDLAVKALALNGASITDGAGNRAVLAGAATNPAGILPIDAGPKIVILPSGVTQTTTYNLDGSVHDIAFAGITGKSFTAYDTTYNANGSIHDVLYSGFTGQAYTSEDVLYGANNKPASATYSNGMTQTWTYNPDNSLHDVAFAGITGKSFTAYDTTYNADGSIHDVLYSGFAGQAYTSEDVLYGANNKPASATYSNGMTQTWTYNPDNSLHDVALAGMTGRSYTSSDTTYNADGSIHDIAYAGVTGQTYTSYDVLYGTNNKPASATYSDGMTQAWSYYPSGVLEEIQQQNVTGKSYTALENDYDASGNLTISNTTNTDGSHTIAGHQNGLTLSGTPGADKIIGGGLNETFSFTGPFGHDTLGDFASHISGPGHDTLSLPEATFQNLTQVMASTVFINGGALIIADGTDTISVPGLTQAAMLANPGSFSFHA
jgi:VCBS repeat-containing protein